MRALRQKVWDPAARDRRRRVHEGQRRALLVGGTTLVNPGPPACHRPPESRRLSENSSPDASAPQRTFLSRRTNETAVLLDKQLPEVIPEHDFYHEYYSEGGYKLRIPHRDVIENVNSKVYLNNVKTEVLENLRMLEGAPGVQMHELPPEHQLPDLDDDESPDERCGAGREAG